MLYFLDLVKRMHRDFGAEKVKPVFDDYSISEFKVFCIAGWMELRFLSLQKIFKSSAKSVDWTGNFILSHMSLIAMRKRVTDIVES